MTPRFDIDKIRFSTDSATFQRGVGIYESGKVTNFKEEPARFSALVIGTKPYRVYVSVRKHDEGDCSCYLGQENVYCKHMVAVGIRAVKGGKPLTDMEKTSIEKPICSGRTGELDQKELTAVKAVITASMRYIKAYSGSSRIWFAYQNSLQEGCNRLSALVSSLPISEQTARLLVDLLLRLDKKLSYGGVDDSDGTVGGFIEEVVEMLVQFIIRDPNCKRAFRVLENKQTGFGWEKPLLDL